MATDVQVQNYVDSRVRPLSEKSRDLLLALKDAKAVIDDIYNTLNVPSPTWTDQRTDGPPHLASPANVLAWNSFITDVIAAIEGHGQYPVVQSLCVRAVG